MDLTLMNKAQRQDYEYVRACMLGAYDISIHTTKARRNRRILTKILDKWLEEGHIEDYRMSRGTPIEDAFGVHGQDVKLMIEIFTGHDMPSKPTRYRVSWEDTLPELPPLAHRQLDHTYQGTKHPFHYTIVQRQMEEKRALKQWQCEQAGVPFKLGTPFTLPKRKPSHKLGEILKKERLF